MPAMLPGTRGGPVAGVLREVGATKQPYFRNSARLYDLKPQMTVALDRAIAVFFRKQLPVFLTSAWRATSPTFSLHLFGYAIDLDTDRSLPLHIWAEIREATQAELGSEFQVLAHDAGQGMHLHIEWDPPADGNWEDERADLHALWTTERRG